ncbi:MAG TPA: YfbM family protein [Firmicutes bacterium]|nr:YfbM family protein [Bacillota bacterium]
MSMICCFKKIPANLVEGDLTALEEYIAELDIEELAFSDDPDGLSLDKAWHGVHFLLTGSSMPTDDLLSDVIMGGTEVGDDLGYGPARYLKPEEVAALAEGLGKVTQEDLYNKFSPDGMTDVYPDIWDEEDAFEYLLDNFFQLSEFFMAAAKEYCAMLVCVV